VIYADHNATTPPHPDVIAAMTRALEAAWGNPASPHRRGAEARRALGEARRAVSVLVRCEPDGVVFTSGGTEANNLVLHGSSVLGRRRIVVSAIEHHSILVPAAELRRAGAVVDLAPVSPEGVVDLERLGALVREDTALVSVQWVNNETGVVQPIEHIAALAHGAGAAFHTDAVQGVGKLDPAPLEAADFVTLSAHKLQGPKGAGALCRRGESSWTLAPLVAGGGQERGLRSGTPNVSGVVGFGVASRLVEREIAGAGAHLAALTEVFEKELRRLVPGAIVFGNETSRAPGTTACAVPGLSGESAVIALDLEGIAISSGAACTTGAIDPSHVLSAMGVPPALARAAVRVSFGRTNEVGDAARVAEALGSLARKTARVTQGAGAPAAGGERSGAP